MIEGRPHLAAAWVEALEALEEDRPPFSEQWCATFFATVMEGHVTLRDRDSLIPR
jgi:hypothetical protein